jgi:hypothetical protein
MKKAKIPVFILAFLLFVGCISGQSQQDVLNPPSPDELSRAAEQRRQEITRINNKLGDKADNGMIRKHPVKYELPRTKPDGKPYTKEELEKIRALLDPHPGDLAKYKDFLQQPDTGMFRLFPYFDCISKNLISVNGDCENFIQGTWSYSFRRKDYSDENLYDIRLKDGNLIADGFLSQEILVGLGDVPLENISLTSEGMKTLVDFNPKIQSQEAKKQFREITKGINSDGYKYTNSIKAAENTTYAMRIIAYRTKNRLKTEVSRQVKSINISQNRDPRISSLNNDKRIDLILAFRIIRKDDDGNITILWKELNRQNSPKLIFEKNERLSDIKEN